jgi:antitoxin component of MazEF toxin-antitoxin module
MQFLKVNSNLLLEIPNSMVKKMGIKAGEKIAIYEKNGEYVLRPTMIQVINKMQDVIIDNIEENEWVSEEDVIEYVKEIRKEKKIIQ